MTSELIGEPLADAAAAALAGELSELTGGYIYPASLTTAHRAIFFLVRDGIVKRLGILSASGLPGRLTGASRPVSLGGESLVLSECPLNAENAAAMRELFPYLVAQPLGLRKSAGCGDRLGLATPGHLRAIRQSTMAPILAQQSIRENARTGRTPQQVMDEAIWGIFEDGWRGGFGADADHLKNTADIDVCAAAGFTFYTIDPGEHVDNEANDAPVEVLREKIARLPWAELETSWESTQAALGSQPIDLGSLQVPLSEEDLLRAAAKYGWVVAHTVKMYRHLAKAKEISHSSWR